MRCACLSIAIDSMRLDAYRIIPHGLILSARYVMHISAIPVALFRTGLKALSAQELASRPQVCCKTRLESLL